MKVEVITTELGDDRLKLIIKVDDKREACFIDGEPEDNSLCRNFNDCFNISNLMHIAYEAGKNGEKFELTETDICEDG